MALRINDLVRQAQFTAVPPQQRQGEPLVQEQALAQNQQARNSAMEAAREQVAKRVGAIDDRRAETSATRDAIAADDERLAAIEADVATLQDEEASETDRSAARERLGVAIERAQAAIETRDETAPPPNEEVRAGASRVSNLDALETQLAELDLDDTEALSSLQEDLGVVRQQNDASTTRLDTTLADLKTSREHLVGAYRALGGEAEEIGGSQEPEAADDRLVAIQNAIARVGAVGGEIASGTLLPQLYG